MKKNISSTDRKMKIFVIFLCLFWGMLAITSTAQSDDYKYSFMFTVPVQMKNLSVYAKKIRLICSVKDANGNFLTENMSGPNYGNDRAAIDSKGSFSGTLTYAFKLTDPAEASKAKTYLCMIQPEDQFMTSHNFADCNSDTAFYCLKPGTARTLEIQGAIQ
jgi:hypothetical protein